MGMYLIFFSRLHYKIVTLYSTELQYIFNAYIIILYHYTERMLHECYETWRVIKKRAKTSRSI